MCDVKAILVLLEARAIDDMSHGTEDILYLVFCVEEVTTLVTYCSLVDIV